MRKVIAHVTDAMIYLKCVFVLSCSSAMLWCHRVEYGWICSLRPLVMDGVNNVSVLAGCLDPMTPICVSMYVWWMWWKWLWWRRRRKQPWITKYWFKAANYSSVSSGKDSKRGKTSFLTFSCPHVLFSSPPPLPECCMFWRMRSYAPLSLDNWQRFNHLAVCIYRLCIYLLHNSPIKFKWDTEILSLQAPGWFGTELCGFSRYKSVKMDLPAMCNHFLCTVVREPEEKSCSPFTGRHSSSSSPSFLPLSRSTSFLLQQPPNILSSLTLL